MVCKPEFPTFFVKFELKIKVDIIYNIQIAASCNNKTIEEIQYVVASLYL